MKKAPWISMLTLLVGFSTQGPSLASDVVTITEQDPSHASDVLTIAAQDARGAISRLDRRPAQEAPGDVGIRVGGSRDATILWHRHHDDAIYTSTGISEPMLQAFAGTYLNPPQQVELVSLLGGGSADWVHPGNHFLVDAARGGSLFAAVDFDDTDSSATILAWRAESSTPLWSYAVYPCRSLTYAGWASRKPIQVSDDGSTIAVGITMHGTGGLQGRLLVFDPESAVPAVDYSLPSGSITGVEVTRNGDFVALASWPTVYVYDRTANSLRWSGSIGAGNDALAISGDGRYLAWGWTTFYLREWNGSIYAPVWTYDPPGSYYVGQCALSTAEDLLALTWDNGSSDPNELWVELYELPSLALLWDFDYHDSPADRSGAAASGAGQDARDPTETASYATFAPDGDRFAVASWGGTFPEVHVFARSDSFPIFVLDTPGTMFDIDIVTTLDGTSYVAACGKNVHTGISGRGGDFYAIEIPGPASDAPGATDTALAAGFLRVGPNPFRHETRIAYGAPASGSARLGVYDLQGRLIRRLTRMTRAGTGEATWDGRDESGLRVGAGVYWVRFTSGETLATRKILLLP